MEVHVSVDAVFNGLEMRDKVKNVYLGYQISMLVMVQPVSVVKTVLKHKRKGIDAIICTGWVETVKSVVSSLLKIRERLTQSFTKVCLDDNR